MTGGFSNFCIFTGFAFSGGRASDRFAAPSPEFAVPVGALGLGAGLATPKGRLSITLLRAYTGAQTIIKREIMRLLIRIVLFTFPAAEAESFRNYFPVTCGFSGFISQSSCAAGKTF
jgi:hypothetical protein